MLGLRQLQGEYLVTSLPELPPIVPAIALIILLIAAVVLVRSLMSSGKSQQQKPKKAKKTAKQPKKKDRKQAKKIEPSQDQKTVLVGNDYEGTILLGQNTGDQPGSATVVDSSAPLLTLVDAANPNQRCTICMNQAYRLGRDEDLCDIVFPADPYISREQCEIYYQNGTVNIRNLSRKNVTRINNKEVQYPMPLNNGMEILIGNTTLRVEIHLSN